MNTTIGIGTRSRSPTHNNIPARLDRTDAASFLNRLAYLTSVGTISQNMRIIDCRNVKRVLNDRRNHGKRLPGNASTSLPAEFTFPPRTSPHQDSVLRSSRYRDGSGVSDGAACCRSRVGCCGRRRPTAINANNAAVRSIPRTIGALANA